MNKSSILRDIPQVERIVQEERIQHYLPLLGRLAIVIIIRDNIESFRTLVTQGKELTIQDLFTRIIQRCEEKRLERLQRVINGTGVIMHTNLGRSPISESILVSMQDLASGYCNLEYHIPSEQRGKRGGMAEDLICQLTGAEDALIVNNNASSVFLILKEFAEGKEVIVSRGELIQIGGGFRIPDIMKNSGAHLVEVGTTNITDIKDFSSAITENTSMILSAHQSNYKIEGFTESPSLKELSSLKNEAILFVRDLGSGNLVFDKDLPQPFEPTIQQELNQGPDLLCFSGDKLLGSAQAGIIVGRKDLIKRLRTNPLMRMIRVDKLIYYIIQETLIKYSNGNHKDLKLWDILYQERKELLSRRRRLIKRITVPEKKKYIKEIDTTSTYGGGSLPTRTIPSIGVGILHPDKSPDEIMRTLLQSTIPIVGTVVADMYTLDIMTIQDKDLDPIAASINSLLSQ